MVHFLVGGRLREHLGCVGTMLLVVLGEPRACSGRKRGYAQASTINKRDVWLYYPHLMSSEVENEHVP